MGSTSVGIIAFAFGKQATHAAGPSNEEIANVAEYVYNYEMKRGNTPCISTQWEVAVALDVEAHSVTAYDDPENYIDTKGVLDRSFAFFADRDVQRVILVAHPFHLFFIKLLIKLSVWQIPAGVTIDNEYRQVMKIIPYDRSEGNTQWWTRNPFGFVAYLAKAFVTREHGS